MNAKRRSDVIRRMRSAAVAAGLALLLSSCTVIGGDRVGDRDALGGRGATTQYDPAGAADSVRRVREFLAGNLAGPAGT
jgi:hypothetical protein